MDSEQCDAAFPRLFDEIHRAARVRRNNHITPEELDGAWRGDGFVRAMIYDGQVRSMWRRVFCGYFGIH